MLLQRSIIFIFIFIFFIPKVLPTYYSDYYFCNEEGQQQTNVNMIGWRCLPSNTNTCANVDRSKPFVINTMPLNSENTNYLRINFVNPTTSGDYYIWYVYTEGYNAKKGGGQLYQHTGSPTLWYTRNCESSTTLQKKDYCSAIFTPSIQSCAEAGLPLSILTDTELNAETASTYQYTYYWPPELAEWDRVVTRMNVDIKKQGTSSSVSGFPTYDEAQIAGNTNHNFQFLWQTSKNTDSGYYTITMTSTVPDEKCDQATMLPTRREMTVYIAKSLDGCVATLTDFNLGTTSFVLNQPVSFTGRKLNSYQDWNHTGTNCEMKGVLNSETYFDSTYTLRIINQSNSQVVAVKTGSLLRNTQPNAPISFSVQWDSARPGRFIANLTIQSTGSGISVCSNEGILTSQTLTFNVGNDNDGDGWYDIEGDCNDNNRNINPGVTEICNNGVDDDCNSATSDICVYSVYYCDRDNDGVYSSVSSGTCIAGTSGCPPAGCTFTSGNDCNDNDGSVRSPQRYYRDIDGDGFGNPLVSEIRCPAQGWLLNNNQIY